LSYATTLMTTLIFELISQILKLRQNYMEVEIQYNLYSAAARIILSLLLILFTAMIVYQEKLEMRSRRCFRKVRAYILKQEGRALQLVSFLHFLHTIHLYAADQIQFSIAILF